MDSNTFLCTTCGSTFRERWELKCHNQKFHDTRVFNCQICNLEVIGLYKMQGHKNIEEFKEAFENVHQLFGLSETLKVHVILSHYSDYFEITGKTFRETNGEHHEALHHTLKTMERNKNLFMRKNHGGVVHRQKSHQSISTRNVLSAGFTPKAKLRIRKSRTSSVSSNSPRSSPMKKIFNHSKSFITNFLNKIDE